MVRFAAFTDIHGSVETTKKVMKIVKKNDVDFMVFTGDFATYSRNKRPEDDLEDLKAILCEIASIEIPLYFVWGNRDLDLLLYFSEKPDEFTSILGFDSLNLVKSKMKIWESPKIYITSQSEEVDRKTIFIAHFHESVVTESLLHLEGHVHHGQFKDNYTNLGFVYRDDYHRAIPMEGVVWVFEIDGDYKIDRRYELLGNLKEFRCPTHADEGVFLIPNYWKYCPVCYDPANARFVEIEDRKSLPPYMNYLLRGVRPKHREKYYIEIEKRIAEYGPRFIVEFTKLLNLRKYGFSIGNILALWDMGVRDEEGLLSLDLELVKKKIKSGYSKLIFFQAYTKFYAAKMKIETPTPIFSLSEVKNSEKCFFDTEYLSDKGVKIPVIYGFRYDGKYFCFLRGEEEKIAEFLNQLPEDVKIYYYGGLDKKLLLSALNDVKLKRRVRNRAVDVLFLVKTKIAIPIKNRSLSTLYTYFRSLSGETNVEGPKYSENKHDKIRLVGLSK